MSTSFKGSPWEIWLAYVRFEDHPDVGKVRPVVVLDNQTTAIVVAKVTTGGSSTYEYYELLDWEVEGLVKPSRVQIAPLFFVPQSDFLRDSPIGTLTERDRKALSEALSRQ